MFKVNEYVVYKRDICKVADKKVYNDKKLLYKDKYHWFSKKYKTMYEIMI